MENKPKPYNKFRSRTWIITCYAMILLVLAIVASTIVGYQDVVWPWMSMLVPGLIGVLITFVGGEKFRDVKSLQNGSQDSHRS